MTWFNGRLALFDIESTGVDPHRDRIVTAAVISAGAGHPTRTREWLVNPEIPIPQAATDVHGITNDDATKGADLDFTAYEIAVALLDAARQGIPIIGHNATYDLTMLHAHLLRAEAKGDRSPARRGNPGMVAFALKSIKPVVDTLILDKYLDPWRPKEPTRRRPDPATCGSRRLVDACRVHGITLTEEEAHGAAADALAAGRLAWRLAQDSRLPVDLRFLHDFQVDTKAEQAADFEAWLRKQGRDEQISRAWPIQDYPHDWTPDQLPNHEPVEEKEEAA